MKRWGSLCFLSLLNAQSRQYFDERQPTFCSATGTKLQEKHFLHFSSHFHNSFNTFESFWREHGVKSPTNVACVEFWNRAIELRKCFLKSLVLPRFHILKHYEHDHDTRDESTLSLRNHPWHSLLCVHSKSLAKLINIACQTLLFPS